MIDCDQLSRILEDNGASLVGFADVSAVLKEEKLNRAVSIAVKIPESIIAGIADGPDRNYFDAYHSINDKLDKLDMICADFIRSSGYNAFAQTTDAVEEFGCYRTRLPHKTAAVMSGLGWIGKSALFVCREYGSAVRLSSVLTDAPLKCAEPVTKSECGDCMECFRACPAGAVSGKLWTPDTDRDEFFDPLRCRKKAREIAAKAINEEITLCGKCIYICPYTQKYINK